MEAVLPRDIQPATFASANLFIHPNWIYELKYDGFRGLALIDRGQVTLVSKNGIVYKRFPALCEQLAATFGKKELIIDGEICCVDGDGRPRFYDLLFRRGEPIFAAFDILWSGGKDLRQLPLLMLKRILRKLLPAATCARPRAPHILYVDYTEDFSGLFDLASTHDLEGIVIKPKTSP